MARTSARNASRRRTRGHEADGAVFANAGLWLRAPYLPQAGETMLAQTSRARRARCVTAVGVVDVSTLGKIDVQGADAAAFLDRVYVNTLVDAAGRARALRP